MQVTPKGRTLLERAGVTRRERMQQALAGFPPRDIELFVRLLNTYIRVLEKES